MNYTTVGSLFLIAVCFYCCSTCRIQKLRIAVATQSKVKYFLT